MLKLYDIKIKKRNPKWDSKSINGIIEG